MITPNSFDSSEDSFLQIEAFFEEFPNLSSQQRLSCWAAFYWVDAAAKAIDKDRKNRYLSSAAHYFQDVGILEKAELIEKALKCQPGDLLVFVPEPGGEVAS